MDGQKRQEERVVSRKNRRLNLEQPGESVVDFENCWLIADIRREQGAWWRSSGRWE